MTEKPTPPEWLPNWKNVDEYPSLEGTSNQQWAWEFLRRNQDFQESYKQYKDNPTPSMLCDIQDRYGIYVTSDENLSPDNTKSEISSPELYEFPVILPKKIKGPQQLNRTLTAEHKDEAIVKFNLALSIDAQLDKVKNHLKKLHEELKIDGVIPQKIQKNSQRLQKYLRVLDALNSGTEPDDIIFGLQLYRTKLEPPFIHPATKEEMLEKIIEIDSVQRQTTKDITTAKELCDNKYTSLLDAINFNDPTYMEKIGVKEYK